MSAAVTGVKWEVRAVVRYGLRTLWDEAKARPREGITDEDAEHLLRAYGFDGAREVLAHAVARRHLLRVSRMRVDDEGCVAVEPRYFTFGGRP